MKNTLQSRPISLYIIYGINEVGLNDKIQTTKDYSPTMKDVYDDHNNDKICFKYIDYTPNSKCTDYSNFLENKLEKDLLHNYYANSCYFNILMDTYCQNFNKYGHNKNITGQLAQILNKRYNIENQVNEMINIKSLF